MGCATPMLCKKGVVRATPYADKMGIASIDTKTRLFKHTEYIQPFCVYTGVASTLYTNQSHIHTIHFGVLQQSAHFLVFPFSIR